MARGDRNAAVKIDGLTDFRRDLKGLRSDLHKQLQRRLRVIAREVAAKSAAEAPRRTGKMAASYRGKATTGLRATVSNTQFYGRFVELGHKSRDGQLVEGQHIIGNILERDEDRIVEQVADAFDQAARDAGWH